MSNVTCNIDTKINKILNRGSDLRYVNLITNIKRKTAAEQCEKGFRQLYLNRIAIGIVDGE